jgi:hypothetical protein
MQPAGSDAQARPTSTVHVPADRRTEATHGTSQSPYGICTPVRPNTAGKGGRRLASVALVLLLALTFGALAAGSAFAAAPEAPSIRVEAVRGTTARLHGVLDPGKEGRPGTFASGTYQFLYRVSSGECKGGLQEPVFPGLTFGAGQENVFAELSGLQPNTKYTACVAATNEASETTVSSPVTFKTALPPEAPRTEPATEVGAKTARFHGVLNPGAAGEAGYYIFYYLASATKCQGEHDNTSDFEPASGGKAEAVSAEVTNLLPKTTYTFCLVAVNGVQESAVGSVQTFETPAAAPSVENEALSSVTATEAILTAQIDPDAVATSYHVDYGASTPDASLPASSVPVGVQQRLTGLAPASEYQVRFVATNSLGTTEGELITLKTPASAGPATVALPDGRAYEMVSPPDDRDVYLPDTSNLAKENRDRESPYPFRAAADGDAVVYEGDAPSTGGNGLELPGGTGNAFMATRGPDGWTATDITPAPAGPKELIQSVNYAAFSSDLSVGVLISSEGGKGKPLAASASICDGLYDRSSDDGAFHALFEATPVPTPNPCGFGEFYAGASANSAHQLFQTKTALTSESEETSPPEEEVEECSDLKCNLYDAVAGRLISVNTLGGKPAPDATFGSQPRTLGTHGIHSADLSNVISEDGSRIFWTDLNTEVTAENPEGVTRLFVRENDTQPPSPLNGNGECTVPADSCSVQIDKAEAKASGHSGGGRFWTATSDGSRVFFTDCSRLTEDSTAVTSGGCREIVAGEEVLTGNDLYEYDVETGQLTDLTVDHNAGDPLGANVLGVIGASQDGSYVYFVAGGALAPGATPGTCKPAVDATHAEYVEESEGKIPPGTGCNLYVLHRGEPLRFVAELSWRDDETPGTDGSTQTNYGDWYSNLGGRTAEVTPDGRHLVFESWHSITGYDNVTFENGSRVEGQAHVEAFVYAAEADRVSCVSCDPSGAAPEGKGAEGLLPGSEVTNTVSTYMLRWISEDGTRVFFDSRQPLVPQDNNGRTDVYEWEQEGTPGCPAAATARQDGGCTFLLSGGNSTDASLFVDASANGDDVFFTTRAKLVPQDHDENVKLYDARVGGGFPETSLACTGTGCQGVPPGPPIFATPSSVTFSGVGNYTAQGAATPKAKPLTRAQKLARALKACRAKKSKHKRSACETQARKRYGAASKARKATNDRRAK